MKEYIIPTLYLPVKSIPRISTKPWSIIAIKKQESSSLLRVLQSQKKQHKDFLKFSLKILKLRLDKNWKIVINKENVHIMFTNSEYCTLKYEICVDISLGYSI